MMGIHAGPERLGIHAATLRLLSHRRPALVHASSILRIRFCPNRSPIATVGIASRIPRQFAVEPGCRFWAAPSARSASVQPAMTPPRTHGRTGNSARQRCRASSCSDTTHRVAAYRIRCTPTGQMKALPCQSSPWLECGASTPRGVRRWSTTVVPIVAAPRGVSAGVQRIEVLAAPWTID